MSQLEITMSSDTLRALLVDAVALGIGEAAPRATEAWFKEFNNIAASVMTRHVEYGKQPTWENAQKATLAYNRLRAHAEKVRTEEPQEK